MQPLIGIPCQLSEGKEENGAASACRYTYIDSICAAGGVPFLIPLGLSLESLRELYDRAHGILLAGGSDVNPVLYGESPHPKLGKTSLDRDSAESNITRWAFEDSKPLLGICRGIQIMNASLGGTLYQDIPSQMEQAINHSSQGEGRWERLAHNVDIADGSRLSSILGATAKQVNSLHHQAIKILAPVLAQAARSEDGIVEAVECSEKYFFVGVQWHPEVLWQKVEAEWLKLFCSFVSAAGKS